MAKKRPESVFIAEFGKAWDTAGGDWYKIPDASGPLARFAVKRRYDVHAAIGGEFFVIEGKFTKSHTLKLSDLRPHQLPALVRAAKFGYRAFVLVCYGDTTFGGKVADFFDAQTLERIRLSGENVVPHEARRLRVYKLRGMGWDLHAEQMSDMVSKPAPVLHLLFDSAKA